ncbi:uncharacterized protein K460DRAFT_349890 [Cucurbitaria berberidis CBS 394.84]|uniref:Uncharacterized protein n=1 Tax=Cucurbitaria berberidis CBS 394.84 TaxID=1168544 RepID=A0A9P4GRF3_9PLEO|nr:uncharacterized protein K460DRAFT_349890 [Cucurbitaria berberidis CBS 394.84]KAF1849731.1 hypothetical protein K460DRAFT_349890 [Cucurbitaria berberidis CBS 394.84]
MRFSAIVLPVLAGLAAAQNSAASSRASSAASAATSVQASASAQASSAAASASRGTASGAASASRSASASARPTKSAGTAEAVGVKGLTGVVMGMAWAAKSHRAHYDMFEFRFQSGLHGSICREFYGVCRFGKFRADRVIRFGSRISGTSHTLTASASSSRKLRAITASPTYVSGITVAALGFAA